MTDLEILTRTLLALGFGAILGLETETRTSDDRDTKLAPFRIGGVRTYTVLTLFGALSGILFYYNYPVFAYMMFGSVLLLVLAAYVLNVWYAKAFGITTEIAILIAVLIGFSATAGIVSLQVLIVLIVILTFILSQKQGISVLARNIAHEELIDVVKFLIVTAVILPFLPNQDYFIHDFPILRDLLATINITNGQISDVVVINPFKLWEYVVLISGFNLIGYVSHRIWGRMRGLLLSGIFGGFISSTATTIGLAAQSKKENSKTLNYLLVSAAIVATGVSFVPITVLSISIDFTYFKVIYPAIVGMVLGSILAAFVTMKFGSEKEKQVKTTFELKPFSLTPALRFALLLTFIKFVLQLVNIYLGPEAFTFTTALSGVVGIDVMTITLGELYMAGEITLYTVAMTFLAANGINFLAKIFYSTLQAKPLFWKVLAISMGVVFFAGVIGTLSMTSGV